MNTLSDGELIRTFAEQQSNAAFAELVRRHLGLVYASALRQVRSPDLANDVAQAVFLLLARKASTLPSKVILSGWLFRSTRFIAARVMRDEDLRHRREQEAAAMDLSSSPSDNELWQAVEPHLDDALATLGEKDRQAVLLRFLEGKRLREVGELMGLGEDAAKKRVNRAIEKLRTALGRRGVAIPALTLTGVLAGAQAHAAPVSLAQMIGATTATTVVKSSITALVAGAARAWAWHQTRRVLILGGSAAAILIFGASLLLASRSADFATVRIAPASSSSSSNISATPTKLAATPLTHSATASKTPVAGRRILLNVRDKESDEPIAGVRVLPCVLARGHENYMDESFTGPDGTCEVPLTDPDLATLLVWLSTSNHVPILIAWPRPELTEDTILYTTHLERGSKLNGRVVNEEGQPIGGTRIRFEARDNDSTKRERINFTDKLSTQMTGADGRFASDQMPADYLGRSVELHYLNTNYASAMDTIHAVAELATNRTMVLLRGEPVRGQVVNLQGDPIGGATLLEGGPDNSENVVPVRTGPDGNFEIPHATPEPRYWSVSAKGYAEQVVTVAGTTDAAPMTVTLQEKKKKKSTSLWTSFRTRVVGTVVDADTGELVPKFKVMTVIAKGDSQLYADGVNGSFDWKMGMLTSPNGYAFQVEAEGYLPELSETRTNTNELQKYEFRLHRGTELTGIVLQPDGQPAAGAIVSITPLESPYPPMVQEDGQLEGISRSDAQTRADAAGRFVLPPQRGKIVISHPSGFLPTSSAAATNAYFTLQPWGRITGTFVTGHLPSPGQEIILLPATATNLDFGIYRHLSTDNQGRFRFINVPAGNFTVEHVFTAGPRRRGALDRRTPVTVKTGETAQVNLGGVGRAVTGKLELARTIPGYEWASDLQALVVTVPNLPEPEAKNFTDVREYLKAQGKWHSQVAQYFLGIQPDGTFRADDVPPGNYELRIKLTKAPLSIDNSVPGGTEGIKIGGTNLNVNVPVADAGSDDKPVDLGTITVPVD